MKKAWELSVLCAADVSIMIFSSQGKAYEFSSKELDSEIDKYLDVGAAWPSRPMLTSVRRPHRTSTRRGVCSDGCGGRGRR